MRRRRIKTASANCQEFVFIVGNTAARTAHGEEGRIRRRGSRPVPRRQGFVHRVADKGFQAGEADFSIVLLKAAAVFRLVDRVFQCAD